MPSPTFLLISFDTETLRELVAHSLTSWCHRREHSITSKHDHSRVRLVVTSLLMAITMRSHWYGPLLFSHGQNGTGLQMKPGGSPQSFRSCPGFRSHTSCAAQLHGFSRIHAYTSCGALGSRLPKALDSWVEPGASTSPSIRSLEHVINCNQRDLNDFDTALATYHKHRFFSTSAHLPKEQPLLPVLPPPGVRFPMTSHDHLCCARPVAG